MNGDNQGFKAVLPPTAGPAYSASTIGVHGDDSVNETTDVAPAMHVSTTYRYASDPEKLVPAAIEALADADPSIPFSSDKHIYSRLSAPNTTRLESILSKLLHAPCLTYSSGLAAFHALLIHAHPRVVAIGAGYHGCHGVLHIYQKLTNCTIVSLHDTAAWDAAGLGAGDLVHLETPLNPSGEASDISAFAAEAHKRGALLSVDATFAPPPLLDPFAWGADLVMHSGTKYFGGHSDMLCGVLAVSKKLPDWQRRYWDIWGERLHLGSVMGSLEGWLGVRSLRTLELRVMRQSASATELVRWLHDLLTADDTAPNSANSDSDSDASIIVKRTVSRVQHASLQAPTQPWLREQMPHGYGPVFALFMQTRDMARRLPSKLALFHHATSLGGVESLIEWRKMSDPGVDERMLRVSVGVEDVEDLKADVLGALRELVREADGGTEEGNQYGDESDDR